MPGDTHTCGSCGDGQGNPNPLDSCGKQFISCENPCRAAINNTVVCESLPSRVENFTKNFFGDVIRTEVNGQVVWSLPCGLDTGLPNNPRGVDEGLACYFLRLFNDGIIGLTGPQGFPGAPGCAGHNAYTVTLQDFNTPAVGDVVTVQTIYNPAMLVGSYVFINGAGWYIITATTPTGVLTLQLLVALAGVTFVSAGKLVVPSGAPGISIPGPQGFQGIQGPPGPTGPQGNSTIGPQGPAGDNLLANNQYVTGTGGSDYSIASAAFQTVNFGLQDLSFIATAVGTYMVTTSFDIKGIAVNANDAAQVALFNDSLSTQLPGAIVAVSSITLPTNGEYALFLQALVTTTALNQTIAVKAAYNQGSGAYSILSDRSNLCAFQIA